MELVWQGISIGHLALSYYAGKRGLCSKRRGLLELKKPEIKFVKDQKQVLEHHEGGLQAEE